MSTLKEYVRLDTYHHDASGEPSSQFEKRYLAYLLVAQHDLWNIIHGRDEETRAFRETMPDDIMNLHKDAWDKITDLLFKYGFSKWDLRTGSWTCNGSFYDEEILGKEAKRNQFLFKILMEYEQFRRIDEPSITDSLNHENLRGGPELLLTDEQKLFLAEWYKKRQEFLRVTTDD